VTVVTRLATAVAAAVLLAGCAPAPLAERTAPLPPSRPAPAPSATPCPPDGVRLGAGEVSAAMGLRAMGLDVVNCGRAPYRVNGYPAVRALDDRRAALDVRVLRGVTGITGALEHWAGPPAPLVLQPGERAAAVVVWRTTYADTMQPPVEVTHLEVAPAAGRAAAVLTPPGGLDLGSTGRLGVSPWRRSVPAPVPPSGPEASAPSPARPPESVPPLR
jgi:hypothetical protein